LNPRKARILFVCVENAGRSQMAEGFGRQYGDGRIEVFSAGEKPASAIDPYAVAVMKDVGIDISAQKPKGFYGLPVKDFDYVVTMGCQGTCPYLPAQENIAWQIDDPKDQPIEKIREIRDDIDKKVKDLIAKIPAKF